MALIHLDRCPVCDQSEFVTFSTVQDHSISKESFQLLQCKGCTLVFTQDHPDEHSIGKYYASEDYISHSDTQKGLINRLYHHVRTLMLDKKKNWVEAHAPTTPGSLLDIGCGTGYFPHHMKSAGWKVKGLEPDQKARDYARDKFHLEVNHTNTLFDQQNQYDVITLWHVLEHVHQLNRYLHRFHQLIHSKGLLLIAVPNYTSSDAKKYKEHWAAFDVPRHLWHFSPAAMHKLLTKHKFRIVKKYGMVFDPFYVAMLSEKYKGRSLGTVRGGLSGVLSNLNAVREVDRSSSLIYIAKPV